MSVVSLRMLITRAYQSVAVAPVPGRRPAPTLQASQSTNYTPFILQGGMAIIGGGTG